MITVGGENQPAIGTCMGGFRVVIEQCKIHLADKRGGRVELDAEKRTLTLRGLTLRLLYVG